MMDAKAREVLVLGAEGSGKTLLMRRLKEICNIMEISPEATIPTQGVDVISLDLGGIKVDFREVGATLASRWGSYIAESAIVLFVVDVADSGSFAAAWVLLQEVLACLGQGEGEGSVPFVPKPLCVVLNKLDRVGAGAVREAEVLLRLDELALSQAVEGRGVWVLAGDALGAGLALELLHWVAAVSP